MSAEKGQPSTVVKILEHPLDFDSLFPLTDYTNEGSLRRVLRDLHEKRIIQIIGTIKTKGRPKDVYCKERYKTDNLAHEVTLSRVLLKFGVPCIRGNWRVDRVLLPDATLQTPRPCHVELDLASKSLPALERQILRYEQTDDAVILITTTQKRMEIALQRCETLDGRLMGCTLETALKDPVLTHCDGQRILLKNLLTKLCDSAQPEASEVCS